MATVINWGTTQVNLTSLDSGTFVAILRHKNYSTLEMCNCHESLPGTNQPENTSNTWEIESRDGWEVGEVVRK